MSGFTVLKSFFVIAFGAVVGYSTVQFTLSKESPNRYLASAAYSKMAVEQHSRSLIDMKIKTSDVAATEGDSSLIEVSIEAFSAIPAGIPFTWNLPEGVEVLSGAQSGLLPDFAPNQMHVFTLKVSGFNKLKKSFISFSAKGEIGSVRLQREILFSSRPEDSFEYVVQQYEKNKMNESSQNSKVKKTSSYQAPVDKKKVMQ